VRTLSRCLRLVSEKLRCEAVEEYLRTGDCAGGGLGEKGERSEKGQLKTLCSVENENSSARGISTYGKNSEKEIRVVETVMQVGFLKKKTQGVPMRGSPSSKSIFCKEGHGKKKRGKITGVWRVYV